MADVISEEDFKAEALAFLEANASRRQEEKVQEWGKGSDNVSLFAEKSREQELAEVEDAKKWRQQVFDAGFGWITGPGQYGGRELPSSYERAYQSVDVLGVQLLRVDIVATLDAPKGVRRWR